MALEMFQGEDAEETGMLGGGIDPKNYQLQVNRQPAPGGLSQANPFADLTKARQDALKATQDMINALERRVSGEGYDISRLLFAFGQPTATGSFGSALANLGAEASRQRSEQEKMIPSMMKMRVDLANSRLNQQEGLALNALRAGRLPGANVQAAPGSGAASEAAVGQEGQGVPQGAAQGAQANRLSGFFGLPIDQATEVANSLLSPEKAKEAMNEWLAVNKFQREGDRVVGNAIYTQGGDWIQNPATLAEVKEFPVDIGNFRGNVPMSVGDYMQFRKLLETGGQFEAAKYLVRLVPSLGERIGAIAPSRTLDSTPIAPAQKPVMQPSPEAAVAQPPSEAAAPAQKPAAFETESEKKQRMELEAAQSKADIEGISKEKFELRKPITLKYRDADKIMQIGREMESLASANPQILGILAKGGLGPALLTFFDSGVSGQAGSSRVQVNVGDLPKALSRVVDANPATVQQYAQSKGISISQAKRELQNEALTAQSILLQKERQLDTLINKPDRVGEGSVATYERIMYAQALPTAREDPAKAYIFKVKQLQEQARFDKKVGELMDKFEAKGINDPRKMYKSQEYIDLRNNYVSRLDALYSTFFPSLKNRLASAKKEAGL